MKKNILLIILFTVSVFAFANIDTTIDDIRIVFEDYTGSFSLYRKNSEDKFISMFDTKTFTKTPMFYVLLDEAVLPVSITTGFKVSSSFKDKQATITATLKDKLEMIVYFDLFSANEKGTIDSIKVTSSITNLSNESHEVAVKALFDTYLGENTQTHFSTALRTKITTETSFTDIKNEKWIQSANMTDVVRFIIPESNFSIIDNIVVANKGLLTQHTWNYNVQKGREFHSLNSYNNSAILITWKNTILSSNIYSDIEFYILTGETSYHIPFTWPPEEESVVNTVSPVITNDYGNLSQEDLQEILRILDMINSLRNDNSYLSEQEIISLNAKVDSILENARR